MPGHIKAGQANLGHATVDIKLHKAKILNKLFCPEKKYLRQNCHFPISSIRTK